MSDFPTDPAKFDKYDKEDMQKEITEEVLEKHAGTIFQQAENRLHIQKGIMARMAKHRVL